MSLIGRQSISDKRYRMFGYDIMFRDESFNAVEVTDVSVSASVLDRVMNELGPENVVGGYSGLLKTDLDFLENDIIETIPKETFSLMVLESSLSHPRLPSVLKKRHTQGYRFGINDTAINEANLDIIETLSPWIETVKFDTLRTDPRWAREGIVRLHRMGKRVIASKVETFDTFAFYDSIGTDYFQGYFIKRPHVVQGESLNPSQEQTLMIWNLLQKDADIAEIVESFEKNHALSLQLMRFINSSFFAFKSPITSIRQIITLIGRKALGNWLMLTMAAYRSGGTSNHPLLLMVINRTEIMTGLLKLSQPDASRTKIDTAYLVGMLSLIHLFLNMQHREFLHKINVSPEIEEAMFEAEGEWGELLRITRYVENADYGSIAPFIERHRIDPKQMDRLIASAMEKVNAFDALLTQEF